MFRPEQIQVALLHSLINNDWESDKLVGSSRLDMGSKSLLLVGDHIAVIRFLSRPQSKATFPTDDSRDVRKSELMKRLKQNRKPELTLHKFNWQGPKNRTVITPPRGINKQSRCYITIAAKLARISAQELLSYRHTSCMMILSNPISLSSINLPNKEEEAQDRFCNYHRMKAESISICSCLKIPIPS
ncbi:hypothetical protein D5086_033741 [Populus alba]|uniref:Uncharacterized protein n=1 Tax=Populus alba TaxID=43335 RepID=A0ACC4AHS3_POPAL